MTTAFATEYEVWGGSIAGIPFNAPTAEESAQVYCNVTPVLRCGENVVISDPSRNYSAGYNENRDGYWFVCSTTSSLDGMYCSALTTKGSITCGDSEQAVFNGGSVSCSPPPEPPKTPTSCGGVGNPCQVSTGAKTQTETDFSSGLGFTRSYQTLYLSDVGFGKGWRSSFQQQLSINGDNLYVIERSGRGDPWRKVNGVWESDVDSDYLLAETATGFTVQTNAVM